MYTPYVVAHQPLITSLGRLHRPPSRLPSFIFPNLLLPDALPGNSSKLGEHRRIGVNQRSNLWKKIRMYYSIRREEVYYIESWSGCASLIQSK